MPPGRPAGILVTLQAPETSGGTHPGPASYRRTKFSIAKLSPLFRTTRPAP